MRAVTQLIMVVLTRPLAATRLSPVSKSVSSSRRTASRHAYPVDLVILPLTATEDE